MLTPPTFTTYTYSNMDEVTIGEVPQEEPEPLPNPDRPQGKITNIRRRAGAAMMAAGLLLGSPQAQNPPTALLRQQQALRKIR